jgi:hypothetical protein
MTDNVREAVFGNVGTTISFNVSPTDAPLLEKQFKPQFDASNLIELHNRHFLINMIIKGENAPAFTATTLTLPKPQVDNTSLIIENSRKLYSRPRNTVEDEIREAVKPPENLQNNKSKQVHSTANKEPLATSGEVLNITNSELPVKKKRKRTRSRKNKTLPTNSQPSDNTGELKIQR